MNSSIGLLPLPLLGDRWMSHWCLIACPHWRLYSRRFRRQLVSPFSATVAEIGDYSIQCGQGLRMLFWQLHTTADCWRTNTRCNCRDNSHCYCNHCSNSCRNSCFDDCTELCNKQLARSRKSASAARMYRGRRGRLRQDGRMDRRTTARRRRRRRRRKSIMLMPTATWA